MADQDPDLSQAEKRLKESLTATGKVARDITNKAFKDLIASVNEYADQLKRIDAELEEQLDRYSDIKDVVRGLGEELKKHAATLGRNNDVAQGAKNIYNALNKITSKLVDNQEDLVTGQLASRDVARDLNKVLTISSDIEKRLADAKRQERDLEEDLMDARRSGTQDEIDAIIDRRAALDAITEALVNQQGALTDITANLQQQLESASKIETKVGLGGKLLSGFKKVPVLGDMLDLDGAQAAMQATAAQGGGAFKVMGAGVKALGPALKAALGPLGLIMIAVEAIKMLVDLAFKLDEDFTNMAKSVGVMKDAGYSYYETLQKTSMTSDSIFMTVSNQIKALGELNDAFETSAFLTGKQLEDQVMLTKEIGLSAEEAANLQGMALQSSQSADDFTTSALQGTVALYKQKGILLDGKKVLQDVSKVNGQIAALYKNNPKLIGEAVAKVKALGTTLEQAKNMAQGLLNFEDSIQSQMEAELLTGKQLNLDRARELALRGDIAGAAEEALNNIGSFAEFSNMNVLQQEAIAKAIGMSTDELSNALMSQEKLANLAAEDKKLLDEQIDALMKQGKVEEANALKKRAASAEDVKSVLKQQSASATFEATMERVKEIFVQQLAPSLLRIMTWLGENLPKIIDFAKDLGKWISVAFDINFGPLVTIYELFKSIGQIIDGDIMEGLKNLGLSLLKFVLSPFKILAKIADNLLGTSLASYFTVGPDFSKKEEEPAAAGTTTTIPAKDFVIKTLPEDTVVAAGGTNLGRTNEMIALLTEQNKYLAALVAKDTTLQVDGQKLANVVARNVPTAPGNLLNPSSRVYS